MDSKDAGLQELYQRILVALRQRRFLDVEKLMEERSIAISNWMIRSPSERELDGIRYQTLQLQTEISRFSTELKETLRRTLEVAPALRAYGANGSLSRVVPDDTPRRE